MVAGQRFYDTSPISLDFILLPINILDIHKSQLQNGNNPISKTGYATTAVSPTADSPRTNCPLLCQLFLAQLWVRIDACYRDQVISNAIEAIKAEHVCDIHNMSGSLCCSNYLTLIYIYVGYYSSATWLCPNSGLISDPLLLYTKTSYILFLAEHSPLRC